MGRNRAGFLLFVSLAGTNCHKNADGGPWCSLEPEARAVVTGAVTYRSSVKPILDRKCKACHQEGGTAPFGLTTYEQSAPLAPRIAEVSRQRHMPPWLAHRCCTAYRYDLSLSEQEIGTLERWAEVRAPEGDPSEQAPATTPLGGMSRVDATVGMPATYTPQPRHGGTDDMRCFVLDWPFSQEIFVTGMNPRPGNRDLVHHLIVGTITGDAIDKYSSRQGADGQPGFDCAGGVDFRDVDVLGGSLLGSDFPDGIGKKVKAGSKLLLTVHYSLAGVAPSSDKTEIEFRVDGAARDAQAFTVTNFAWAAGDAMRIEAGDPDAVYSFYYAPDLITNGKTVYLRSVVPHMHRYGSRIAVRVLRKGGDRDCLLEIPRWEFGWEQHFWFDAPHVLEAGDQLYVECHFDNSASRQLPGNAPRDIAWGESDQEMCAAFVTYTEAP